MFPIKETDSKQCSCVPTSRSKVERTFESIEKFATWLDGELELLVNQFEDFETDKSVRKFFQRS